MRAPLRMLNVGCGPTFHEAWTNLDSFAVSPAVITCDIRKGLPFADDHFSACYSSHLLEHLPPAEGERMLREMWRILSPGGIARVVVPDLELVTEDYRQTLHRALAGEAGAGDDYDWMLIQLLDQSVRRRSGGAMSDFWRDAARANVEFVVARAGMEAEKVIAESRAVARPAARRSVLERLRSRNLAQLTGWVRLKIARVLVHAVAGAAAAAAFEEGLFRNSGEIHQWMYDRYSLQRALERAGFRDIQVCTAQASRIPQFAEYELDVSDGRVRKPDSLFMEAVKER
jgi:SAM-dependent methyltransferase